MAITDKPIAHHYLAQFGMMQIIQSHLATRGRERMKDYKRTDFQQLEDENGIKYWKLVQGGETKNHKSKSEDMTKGGRIYFTPNYAGLNHGQYFSDFLTKLPIGGQYLFHRPHRTSKDFTLHENPQEWYVF